MLKLARVLVVAFSGVAALVVLPSLASAETCPNAQYRVGPSANLPDCRAYEQVTPVEKEGGLFEKLAMGPGSEGTPNVVISGFAGIDGIQDDNGAPGALYVITRTASGWVTSPLPPPASEYQTSYLAGGTQTFLGESLDGRLALWQGRRVGQPENRVDFFVSGPGGLVEDVGPLTPPDTPDDTVNEITNLGGLAIRPVGKSADLSRILYQTYPDSASGFHFWPFDETQETPDKENKDFYGEKVEDLYEFVGRNNTAPLLVGVDNEGKLIGHCGTELGAGDLIGPATGYTPLAFHNAVSHDGETAFFTAAACGSSPAVNELFARVGNGTPGAHTVAVSEPLASDCAACDTSAASVEPAFFQGASADGSKVFFVTQQSLLGSDGSTNIYEYDFDALPGEKIIRVTGGDATVSNPTAEVQGIVQTSEDGSHAYFVARGVLTKNPNAQDQVARAGANNLYLFERDAQYPSGRTVFIADLSQTDEQLWTSAKGAAGVLSNITPNGSFIVFTSTTEHLTTDDASTAHQVFEYDAKTGSLTRVSIGQDGYNNNGNTNTAEATISSPGYSESSNPDDYSTAMTVSAGGSYVFFESTDGLTPQALNQVVIGEHNGEKHYAENVYEYRDGNVYLISDGRDLSEVAGESAVRLLGTDESGADVFFSTADPLAPSDIDSNVDIYDARVDGGFPGPAVKQQCAGDECQGVLSAAPVLLAPGSEFQAGGNPPLAPAAPVAKPKVKKVKKKTGKKAKRRTGKAGRRAKGAAAKRGRVHGRGGRS